MARRQRISPQTEAVLVALGEQSPAWSHGYDLCERLDLKAGTVYPILIRLAERGQVEAAWEEQPPRGRPARHLYRLSAAGADLVKQLQAARVTPAPDASARKGQARPAQVRPSLGAAGS